MPDYQGNSKKMKETEKVPVKNVEKVVVGEVIVQKKSIGRKFKDLFIEADLKTVIRYVATDVLLPAARNTIVDASSKGIERLMYGESAVRRRNFGVGPRVTYNNPINRGYRDSGPFHSPRNAPAVSPAPRSSRHSRDEFFLSSREEAELVLERMNDIIDTYEVVSVADLNQLAGLPTTHVDNKWGWVYLGDVQIRQIREGYLIDFPPSEPIQ
jgi:hypothetical protein